MGIIRFYVTIFISFKIKKNREVTFYLGVLRKHQNVCFVFKSSYNGTAIALVL